jgi:hypothetical protein
MKNAELENEFNVTRILIPQAPTLVQSNFIARNRQSALPTPGSTTQKPPTPCSFS